jgi:hypothetical protein
MVLGAVALFPLIRRYGETPTAPAPAAIATFSPDRRNG